MLRFLASSLVPPHSHSYRVPLGEAPNVISAKPLELERTLLGLVPRASMMSSVVGSAVLRIEVRPLLKNTYADRITVSRGHNGSKDKVKDAAAIAYESSAESALEEKSWLDSEPNREEAGSMPVEEAESKIRTPLEKELKKCFEN